MICSLFFDRMCLSFVGSEFWHRLLVNVSVVTKKSRATTIRSEISPRSLNQEFNANYSVSNHVRSDEYNNLFLRTIVPKRHDVSIIFSHDFNPIIYDNKTTNLSVRNDHSYLILRLTDSSQTQKLFVKSRKAEFNNNDEEDELLFRLVWDGRNWK